MNTPTLPVDLDAEELAHLGVALAAQGRLEEALLYLKTAVQKEPGNARANYLLGSHYAQLGMVQRAADFFKQAATIDPQLVMASFQAGLLLMGDGQGDEALTCWRPLKTLADDHPLHLLVTGLEALLREDYARCQQYLTSGIERNTALEGLNDEMRKILDQLERRGLLSKATGKPVSSSAVPAGLTAYRTQ